MLGGDVEAALSGVGAGGDAVGLGEHPTLADVGGQLDGPVGVEQGVVPRSQRQVVLGAHQVDVRPRAGDPAPPGAAQCGCEPLHRRVRLTGEEVDEPADAQSFSVDHLSVVPRLGVALGEQVEGPHTAVALGDRPHEDEPGAIGHGGVEVAR